jgi:hypothetical protein
VDPEKKFFECGILMSSEGEQVCRIPVFSIVIRKTTFSKTGILRTSGPSDDISMQHSRIFFWIHRRPNSQTKLDVKNQNGL